MRGRLVVRGDGLGDLGAAVAELGAGAAPGSTIVMPTPNGAHPLRPTAPARPGGGRIIQISSYGGQVAFTGNSLYQVAKWGIEGFVESVAQEVAG